VKFSLLGNPIERPCDVVKVRVAGSKFVILAESVLRSWANTTSTSAGVVSCAANKDISSIYLFTWRRPTESDKGNWKLNLRSSLSLCECGEKESGRAVYITIYPGSDGCLSISCSLYYSIWRDFILRVCRRRRIYIKASAVAGNSLGHFY
jgi:hypothetical protein